jgi:hypothetical protein
MKYHEDEYDLHKLTLGIKFKEPIIHLPVNSEILHTCLSFLWEQNLEPLINVHQQ